MKRINGIKNPLEEVGDHDNFPDLSTAMNPTHAEKKQAPNRDGAVDSFEPTRKRARLNVNPDSTEEIFENHKKDLQDGKLNWSNRYGDPYLSKQRLPWISERNAKKRLIYN
ncbi:unnamed protein product [Orchesella dallaii]|uniref:Uncharacterized protein n=1 Tax=Orchesella dallaii TaxID=48710 RepID=A0ABP1RHW6_9HEXA